MRISDCEFEDGAGPCKVKLQSLSQEFAIRNSKFEISYAA